VWASPTRWAFPGVVKKLQKEAEKPENRGYADNGIQEFKDAAVRYMERVFRVKGLDPQTEVLHGIGSKPVLAMFPSIFINPGDVTLMTVPGYPVMATHTRWYGGSVVNLPLTAEKGFLPDLDAVRPMSGTRRSCSTSITRTTDRRRCDEGLLREGGAVRQGEQHHRGP